MCATQEAALMVTAEQEGLQALVGFTENDHRRRVSNGLVGRVAAHEPRDTSTRVVDTPIAFAMRASVSSEGVCRPASTRAMFGR